MHGRCHLAFDVTESSQVGQVRRAAAELAEQLGLDAVAAGRLALLATELGMNLVRHATQGRLLLGAREGGGRAQVEILSIDRGPGIAELEACLADGYSTAGTSGNGLGAVRRVADEFDIFSTRPGGTVVMARVQAAARLGATREPEDGGEFDVGAVALPAPGEIVSGDAWALASDGQRAALFMADGLGHGPLAAEAAQAGVAVFERSPFDPPSPVLERVHAGLRGTRGAAVAMARLDGHEQVVTFSGAGNISGRLVSAVADRTLMSQHGTAGLQIRRLHNMRYEWPVHTLLVMHSDGLTTRWRLDQVPALLQRHPSVIAAWLMREHCRGRDDATIVVLRRRGE